MALPTALALAVGSAALIGSSYIARGLSNAPQETEEPVEELAPEPAPEAPVEPPAPVEAPAEPAEPAPEPPAEPEAPAEPIPDSTQQGGGVRGMPPWGVISATLPPDLTGIQKNLGIPINPKDLQITLETIQKEIEDAEFEKYEAKEDLKKLREDNKQPLKDYANAVSSFEASKKRAEFFLNKVNEKPKQLSGDEKKKKNKDLDDQIKEATDEDVKKSLQEEKRLLNNPPAVPDDTQVNKWIDAYKKAKEENIESEQNKKQFEVDNAKFLAKQDSLLKEQDSLDVKIKELKAKRDELLGQITAIEEARKARTLPSDWDSRRKRYSLANERFLLAQRELKIFLSEVWNIVDTDTRTAKYGTKKTILEEALSSAKRNLDAARAALTAPEKKSLTSARSDFQGFVEDINQIVEGEKPMAFEKSREAGNGYSENVKNLVDYLSDTRLQLVGDFYYQLADIQDGDQLVENLPKFLDLLRKVKSNTLSVSGEPESIFRQFSPQVDRISTKFKDFVEKVIPKAYNDMVLYPRPTFGKFYSPIREKVMPFVDKQLETLKAANGVIKKYKKEIRVSIDVSSKQLQELGLLMDELFPVIPQTSKPGKCVDMFSDEAFELLKNAKTTLEGLDKTDEVDKILEIFGFVNEGGTVKLKDKKGELQPIKLFKDACEIDGNVGVGLDTETIKKILEKMEKLERTDETKQTELKEYIAKLKKAGVLIDTREPQYKEAIGLVSEKTNKTDLLSNKMAILDVSYEKGLIETFLTFRSDTYNKIPPTTKLRYKGKIQNARDVYAELAFSELKTYEDFNDIKEDDELIGKLSEYYRMNFYLIKKDAVNDTYSNRFSGQPVHYIFYDGKKYHPIRFMDRVELKKPTALGGAIDGYPMGSHVITYTDGPTGNPPPPTDGPTGAGPPPPIEELPEGTVLPPLPPPPAGGRHHTPKAPMRRKTRRNQVYTNYK